APDGAWVGVHRGRLRGRVRLHEDDHARQRARLARARPLQHHRPARHRGARPRRDRPHGRAREVSDDAARIAAAALAEDGPTDITTAVTVPLGLLAQGSIEYRSGGVLAGAAYADAVARACE